MINSINTVRALLRVVVLEQSRRMQAILLETSGVEIFNHITFGNSVIFCNIQLCPGTVSFSYEDLYS